ncbi:MULTISPECIES: hypothetical protein [Methylomonas]|uniref:Uncharacterized protein n=1 Tax=Methylomonas koyamae TaxID=702114 RepID=A0A177N6L2_9GAMM|nr:hypothetical protein [Methylomonas koyamae]OAI12770.1 hypothetical protein A1355_14120 [Methylomonas koyamae]
MKLNAQKNINNPKENFRETQGFSLFSFENKLLYFYFVTPFIVAILLSDYAEIDISNIISKHIGLIRFIQVAGINVANKAMMFVTYCVFAIFYCACLHSYRNKNNYKPPFGEKSTPDLFSIIFLSLVSVFVMYLVTIVGFDESSLINPSRPIKLLLVFAKFDMSFAIYLGCLIYAGVTMLYLALIGIIEFFHRL